MGGIASGEDSHRRTRPSAPDAGAAGTIARVKGICGLGNPGDRYRWTRHNVGFRVVDLLADRWGHTGDGRLRDGAAVLEVRRAEPIDRVLLVKPMRYMNRSGGPLRAALRHTDVDVTSDVLLVTDDIDLPLGRVRLRRSGSAGGHNGLRDVIASFGTDEFSRLRIGVGRTGEASSHVLATFRPDERDLATEMVAVGADAAERWLRSGIEEAMNAFNGIDLGG